MVHDCDESQRADSKQGTRISIPYAVDQARPAAWPEARLRAPAVVASSAPPRATRERRCSALCKHWLPFGDWGIPRVAPTWRNGYVVGLGSSVAAAAAGAGRISVDSISLPGLKRMLRPGGMGTS